MKLSKALNLTGGAVVNIDEDHIKKVYLANGYIHVAVEMWRDTTHNVWAPSWPAPQDLQSTEWVAVETKEDGTEAYHYDGSESDCGGCDWDWLDAQEIPE